MPTKPQLTASPPPPLLPALLLLISPITWFFLEYFAIQGMAHGSPRYDPFIESLTDLGIDYRQVHELKHHNVHSMRHQWMNADFLQLAVAFGVAQAWAVFKEGRKVLVRGLLVGMFVLGMGLFALIHGGPRERVWQIQGWHWMGLSLLAVAGNLHSVLVAAAPGGTHEFEGGLVYRSLSLVLGGMGLYSFYRWGFTLGEWDYITPLGTWERGCVYPVVGWMVVTGVAMVVERARGVGGGKGKKA